MKFRELGLIDPIVTALEREGYTAPTPIQAKAIPPALAGRDVLGCAQTGTGKWTPSAAGWTFWWPLPAACWTCRVRVCWI